MRPQHGSIPLPVIDVDAVCTAEAAPVQTIPIDGTLATDGVATVATPQFLSITSDGNESGITFTIVGTDRYGYALTETITGPNATTAYSTKNFKTVTSVTTSDDTTGTVSVGTGNGLNSPVHPIDHYEDGVSYSVGVQASANYKWNFEYTLDNVYASSFDEYDATWFDDLTDQTASKHDTIAGPVTACRVKYHTYVAVSGVTNNFNYNILQERNY